MKKIIPQNLKNIYHLVQAVVANLVYGFPSKKIKVVGVTGTNGKTTTCQMIVNILEETGKKVALASTINFKINGEEELNKTKFTTLSSFAVQKFIKKAVKAGCEYLVLETSSHALDQNRVWGVNYQTAVITNITREHLDYHKNMEYYRLAKLKLFENAQIGIVNLDMEKPCDFIDSSVKIKYGFTTKSGGIKEDCDCDDFEKVIAENIELGIQNTKYSLYVSSKHKQKENLILNLPGIFNVENSLAAVSVGLSEGVELKKISQALEKIKNIPGRMESVPNNKNLKIIIDYAVTPDSLEKLYSLIKNLNASKIVAVFGACGERDRGKRPLMGRIVEKYADKIILADEDPYNESPRQIIDEIADGIENKEKLEIIQDRREAIKKALQVAKPGDVVVVTGKGAEETMAVGKKRIPWSDKKVIQEALREL